MANRIKLINMESIFESLCDLGIEEKQAEKLCVNIEADPNFDELFFFSDKKHHDYFYQESDEWTVKQFLSQYMDVDKLPGYTFKDFGDHLYDNCDTSDSVTIGKFDIGLEDVYISLNEEALNIDTYVDQLVNAEDFYNELKKIKKSTLEYLFEMAVTRAKEELDAYEF